MQRLLVIFTLVACLPACTQAPPTQRQSYNVDGNYVRLLPPAGWQHADYGRRHDFRHDRARVTLELMKAYATPPQVDVVLRKLGHNSQRSVASMQNIEVDGREALVVETWDHLSHTMRMRVAIVPCGNRCLVLHTRYGAYAESGAALDAMLASLDIIDADVQPSSLR